MTGDTLADLHFANLDDEELLALKNAEAIINKHSMKKVYLVAVED